MAQNSNMLLTSGSNLIVQNGGNVTVDYIQGNTQQWNYLALNGNGADGAPDVELASAGNISLWAEGGTVNVTGSMRVTGDIIFSGSINLGDYTGDTINFNGEVSSSILPKISDVFDLGGPSNYWHDLYVSGTAYIGNISAVSASFTDNISSSLIPTKASSDFNLGTSGKKWNNAFIGGTANIEIASVATASLTTATITTASIGSLSVAGNVGTIQWLSLIHI